MKRAKKIVLTAPNLRGAGLKALANKLGEKVGYKVYRVVPHRVRRRTPIVFNSGIDKITQLQLFRQGGTSCPEFTCSPTSIDALPGKRIVARKLINASQGRGIVVFEKGEPVPYAPLYTSYIKKKKEFRVHVWNNEVIDVAEKRKRKGYENERDAFIKNSSNGYVYCRADIIEPVDLRQSALSAVRSLSRSYGAVDIIWNQKQNKCYVLEVNSRPGMEGTTVEKYADAILRGVQHG